MSGLRILRQAVSYRGHPRTQRQGGDLGDRCIDCGACAAGCPYHAFNVKTDTLDGLADYAYNIVLPAPSLYAQFPDNIPLESIWQGLHNIGFDEIFDVSLASEYIALEIEEYVKRTATDASR